MEKCKIMENNKVGLTYKIKTLPANPLKLTFRDKKERYLNLSAAPVRQVPFWASLLTKRRWYFRN